MSIYTRRGDDGDTSLADGTRVSKSSARVEAYGAVDEANAAIGVARAAVTDQRLDEVLRFAQHRLFNCAGSLAAPGASPDGSPVISAEDVAALETAVDAFETTTGPLTSFILEAGSDAAARLHLARAVTRRAERRIVELAKHEAVDEMVLKFVNRLSDTLFAAARYANAIDGRADEPWDSKAGPPRL